MHIEQIVDRLLESGDASIQYRIKRESLGVSPDTSAIIRRGDDYEDVPPCYSVLYAIDRAGRGGLRTMRAWLLGLLGAEQEAIVIQEAASAPVHF